MGGSGDLSGAEAAGRQYVSAKTSVWWDIENCQVPKGCNAHAIAQNISSALATLNYSGPVTISAYGDTTRIPSSVQQALSSTGIALNHVPAGVKDASDKKILVDMLFWAVDNAAPANYLLISGDRDFSNALHQLRMRRYNILLAQPQKASAPLVAAAKSVWIWTSLLAGGPPLTSHELQCLVGISHGSTSETLQVPVSSASQPTYQSGEPFPGSPHLGNQKNFNPGRGTDYNKYKGKKNPIHPSFGPMAPSQTFGVHGDQMSMSSSPHSSYAPDVHFGGLPNAASFRPFWNNGKVPGISETHHTRLVWPNNFSAQPHFIQGNMYPTNNHFNSSPPMPERPDGFSFSQGPPDLSKLNINYYDSRVQSPPNFQQQGAKPKQTFAFESTKGWNNKGVQNGSMKPNTTVNHDGSKKKYHNGTDPPSNSSAMDLTDAPPDGSWGTPGHPKPSDYVQGLIGVILLALDTLKNEKIMPTEANIVECIQCGDPKHQNIDVKEALESAIKHQLIVKQNLGNSVQFYVIRNENLWKCVNPLGGNPKSYPRKTWKAIRTFLASSEGKSALMSSRCRYEAGLLMKQMCLKDLALGDILQILNLLMTAKKWIVPHQFGWQPIIINLPVINSTSSSVKSDDDASSLG
ncbi:hypothetical protein SAY86_027728 [Trapa natans]|uniref:NYN domain-containing protein n=1 Tax=Trapa natans TaxID=22666 RepID=A0AAN7QL41_TRANT|nr:hypothetical protein SAY86_027728 [Trapa natans]